MPQTQSKGAHNEALLQAADLASDGRGYGQANDEALLMLSSASGVA